MLKKRGSSFRLFWVNLLQTFISGQLADSLQHFHLFNETFRRQFKHCGWRISNAGKRCPQCGSVPIAGSKVGKSYLAPFNLKEAFLSNKPEKKVKASGLTFGDSTSSRSCNACTNFLVPFICLVFLFRIWTANIQ